MHIVFYVIWGQFSFLIGFTNSNTICNIWCDLISREKFSSLKSFIWFNDFRSQQSWRRQNIQWLWGKDLLPKWRQIPIMFIITSKFEFQIIQIVISIALKNSFRKCWKIECIIDSHNNLEVIRNYKSPIFFVKLSIIISLIWSPTYVEFEFNICFSDEAREPLVTIVKTEVRSPPVKKLGLFSLIGLSIVLTQVFPWN